MFKALFTYNYEIRSVGTVIQIKKYDFKILIENTIFRKYYVKK